MPTTKNNLKPADRARLRELYGQRRYVNSAGWYHPAAWYGAPEYAEQIRTDETRRLTAAIKALTSERGNERDTNISVAPVQGALW